MENSNSNNVTIYLMLIICSVLLTVDTVELYRINLSWSYANNYDPILFNTCIKKELILKTIFAAFSFISAFTASLLCLLICINLQFFLDKLLTSYINMAFYFFGPLMLGFSIFGIINWNEVVFLCDRKDPSYSVFSVSNAFSLIGCLILSLTITIFVVTYESVMLYINSILRRENGNKILRSIFWWAVLRGRPNLFANNINNNEQRNNNI